MNNTAACTSSQSKTLPPALAVFGLAARHSLGRLCLVDAGVAAVQALLFGLQLYRFPQDMPPTLSALVAGSRLAWAGGAGMIAACLLLLANQPARQSAATLARLRLPARFVGLVWGLYNSCMLFVCHAVQAAAVLGLAFWYKARFAAQGPGWPRILIEFYGSGYLHGLWPLADTLRLAANLFCLCALGMVLAAAAFPAEDLPAGQKQHFQGRLGVASFWATLTLLSAQRDVASAGLDSFLILCSIALLAGSAACILRVPAPPQWLLKDVTSTEKTAAQNVPADAAQRAAPDAAAQTPAAAADTAERGGGAQ